MGQLGQTYIEGWDPPRMACHLRSFADRVHAEGATFGNGTWFAANEAATRAARSAGLKPECLKDELPFIVLCVLQAVLPKEAK